MNEKKLTDEEIVKALECMAGLIQRDCDNCHFMIDKFCSDTELSSATLDLIHRLQDENKRLNNRISDMEFVGQGNCMDCKLVEDIYTLDTKHNELKEKTFSYETELLELREDRERFRARNAELQKQVDELKVENERLKGERKLCHNCGKYFLSAWKACPSCGTKPNDVQQAVKDTAKEILQTIKHAKENGQIFYNEAFMITAQKAYGVEVE